MGMNDYLEMLNRSGRPMTKNEIKIRDLQQQLQAYKDKEDKLREYISELSSEEILLAQGFEPMYVNGIIFAYEITKEDILQILNEGSDK
jgi:hypothetical protein